MEALTRLEGWESRLVAAIEAARARPYVLGESDCWRLAAAAIEALTGVNFWPRFSGYRTKQEALRTIARIAPTLGEAASKTFGVRPTPAASARRGDIALFRDTSGEDHLGVVTGAHVMLTLPEGIGSVGIDHAGVICAWRIG